MKLLGGESVLVTINIIRFARPQHQNRKEVSAGYKGDDHGHDECPRCRTQVSWDHGRFGSLVFPQAKDNEYEESQNQGSQDSRTCPRILENICQSKLGDEHRNGIVMRLSLT